MKTTQNTMLGVLLLGISLTTLAHADTVVIENAKVVTGTGRVLKQASILIVDGRISAVKAKLKAPYDAKVIDAKGKVVFPGMILAHTSQGMDRPNESVPVGPYLDVMDSIDPSRMFYEEALRDGLTTLHVIHGDDTVIGGVGRAVAPLGMTIGEMTIRARTAIKLCVAGKRGYDRVRQRALLRETFAELKDYVEGVAEKRYAEEEKKAKRDPVKVPPSEARKLGAKLVRDEDLDDKHRNLWRLTTGRLDAFVTVPRAQDAAFAVKLATDNGFLKRTTFVLGSECFKAVSVFKKAKRPVVLSSRLTHTERDPLTGEESETFVPAVFAKANVAFALQTAGRGAMSDRFLWYQAARCVRGGVSRAKALAAITRVPAAILGLGKRKGEIGKALDADLLILSGDPLDVTTHVEHVLIGGRVVYSRDRDFRLRKLIAGEGAGDGKADDPKKAGPKKAGPKKAGPKKASDPKKDAPKKDTPKKASDPKKDAPKKDTPKKDAPKKDGGK